MIAAHVPFLEEIDRPAVHAHGADRQDQRERPAVVASRRIARGDLVTHHHVEVGDRVAGTGSKSRMPPGLALADRPGRMRRSRRRSWRGPSLAAGSLPSSSRRKLLVDSWYYRLSEVSIVFDGDQSDCLASARSRPRRLDSSVVFSSRNALGSRRRPPRGRSADDRLEQAFLDPADDVVGASALLIGRGVEHGEARRWRSSVGRRPPRGSTGLAVRPAMKIIRPCLRSSGIETSRLGSRWVSYQTSMPSGENSRSFAGNVVGLVVEGEVGAEAAAEFDGSRGCRRRWRPAPRPPSPSGPTIEPDAAATAGNVDDLARLELAELEEPEMGRDARPGPSPRRRCPARARAWDRARSRRRRRIPPPLPGRPSSPWFEPQTRSPTWNRVHPGPIFLDRPRDVAADDVRETTAASRPHPTECRGRSGSTPAREPAPAPDRGPGPVAAIRQP